LADGLDVEPVFVSSRDKVKLTVRIDPYLKQLLMDQALKLGLSSCFLVENYVRAGVTGESVQVPRARPVVVNMRVNYGVERPRRYPRPAPLQVYHWPPNCVHADAMFREADVSKSAVGCKERGDVVPIAKCWDCFYSKEAI